MKKIILSFLLIAISCNLFAQGRNLLSKKYSVQDLQELLIPQDKWIPFPKLNDRAGWGKADQNMLKEYIKEAESLLDYNWPTIPATASLAIARTGNRQVYENISFKKRAVLGALLLGEIAENKGRFIDQIVNGVWSVCEESWWGASAHLPTGKEYSGLIDVDQPTVDLFASETGLMLAWIDYYLGDKLDHISPQIRKRIYSEVDHRLFKPFMTKYHWWMGETNDGRGPNNWNPWICSNWINFVLLLEKDEQRRTQMISRSLAILDEFINWYPQDGGCDEGPSYWGGAASRLYYCLAFLNMATNDAYRYVFNDEKIKNMGRYIYRAQISEEYFLNFADADPKVDISAAQVYLYGKDIQDKDMMEFAAYYMKQAPTFRYIGFYMNFFELFTQEDLSNTNQRLPLLKDVWLPDLQVMAARDKQGTTDGFYVAAKGGHNAEAHNHNDVGSFVIYYDGLPLLIDVGRGTYTARTFNNKRYDIWFNCSDYHNLPTINGINQHPAIEYKATHVSYQPGQSPSFTTDIAKAYPAEAGINKWIRTVQLHRGKQVSIKDNFDLSKAESVTQHIMTCYPSEVKRPGEVIIHYQNDGKKQDFIIVYDPRRMQASIEKIKLESEEDAGVRQKWGDTIHRINFNVSKPQPKEALTFIVKPVF